MCTFSEILFMTSTQESATIFLWLGVFSGEASGLFLQDLWGCLHSGTLPVEGGRKTFGHLGLVLQLLSSANRCFRANITGSKESSPGNSWPKWTTWTWAVYRAQTALSADWLLHVTGQHTPTHGMIWSAPPPLPA